MTRGLLLIILLVSCRSAILPTETFSVVDNDLLCKGTENMIVYLKQSQEIKSSYGDYLHNKEQVGLKIDSKIFKGTPLTHLNDWGFDSTDTLGTKKVNCQCYNQSDSIRDFEVTFSFYPKKKILTTIVMTILNKPGYRSGYEFSTKLEEDGQLGQMRISTIRQ